METHEPAAATKVARVTLEGFRNYANLDIELAPAFNVLTGRNAQGKTNFLEALYLLSTTRLLRGQRDAEAIYDGRQTAKSEVELEWTGTKLGITLTRGARKRAFLNGLPLPRAADLIGRLPSVCVSSEDMAIVRGEPADRRLYLDLELSSLYPSYLRHLTLYKRALEQRNSLLRQSQEWAAPSELFEPWEEQIAAHGSELRAARRRFVSQVAPYATSVHANLGQGEEIALEYLPKDGASDAGALRTALAEARANDIARGGTSVGPHRDDLGIAVGGREARLYGSQGQQRTSVISLKLATLELASEEVGITPLLLLDDILSYLDEQRRGTLIEVVLQKAGQAVLTCTEAEAAGREILDRARVFTVSAGHVQMAGDP